MKSTQRGYSIATYLIAVAICLGFAYGWVMNIVKLVGMADLSVTGMTVLRAVGIFIAPLGAVLGFC